MNDLLFKGCRAAYKNAVFQLSFFTALCAASSAFSATPTCDPLPDCTSLGYSDMADIASTCKNKLLCPFDTNFGICLDKRKTGCSIGDIYYADGTCSSTDSYNSDKTPVGVVFMLTTAAGHILEATYNNNVDSSITSRHGRIVNLHDLYAQSNYQFDPNKPYSGSFNTFMWGLYETNSSLQDYTNKNAETGGSLAYALKSVMGNEGTADIYNGVKSTAGLADIKTMNCDYIDGTEDYAASCIAPAARAAHAFYPPEVSASDSLIGQGHWYLPSMGELMQLYGTDVEQITTSTAADGATGKTKDVVNATLKFLKKQANSSATALTGRYCSSTEHDESYAWTVELDNGARPDALKTHDCYVRAIMTF